MKTLRMTLAAGMLAFGASAALGQSPRMGGEMKHIMVHFHEDEMMLECHVDASIETPVLRNYGETYTGGASVLNGTLYNAQYGWMVEGFWTPPEGSLLWIEQVGASSGMSVYRGSNSWAPIFGTDGSSPRISWNGVMLHNWYAVTRPGTFTATYIVYFGDASGTPLEGYMPGDCAFEWTVACVVDFDGDGFATGIDFDLFVGAFEAGGMSADYDGDGFVTGIDFDLFVGEFEGGC